MRPFIPFFAQEIYLLIDWLQVGILLVDSMLLDAFDLCVQEVCLKKEGTIQYFALNLDYVMCIASVGSDLVKLFRTPMVQMYLNGILSRDLNSDKAIYQHGALRKVSLHNYYLLTNKGLFSGVETRFFGTLVL